MKKYLILSIVFSAAFLVPLLPYIVNGLPMVGDSWVHLKIAREIITSGKYLFGKYNYQWPFVNMLLAIFMMLTSLPKLTSGAIIPLMVGLAVIPLYCLSNKLNIDGLTSVIYLSFNPLYAYVVFSGSIMKETSAYYLFIALLLSILLLMRGSKAFIHSLLLAIALVFAHHYASLAMLLILTASVIYGFGFLRLGDSYRSFLKLFILFILFGSFVLVWNLWNYLILGPFFPVFNLRDILIMISSFIFSTVFLYPKERESFPWVIIIAYVIAVLGLRYSLFTLKQPIESISMWEIRDYALSGFLSILGLCINDVLVRAISASTAGLVLFSVAWGLTIPGYVLLIKSLHYFGIALALGAGLTLAKIKSLGKIWMILGYALLILMASSSYFGTKLALNGLSSYTLDEVIATKDLSLSNGVKVDIRAKYMLTYLWGDFKSGDVILLYKKNMLIGFLMGYDWVKTEEVLNGNMNDNWSVIFNSKPLIALSK